MAPTRPPYSGPHRARHAAVHAVHRGDQRGAGPHSGTGLEGGPHGMLQGWEGGETVGSREATQAPRANQQARAEAAVAPAAPAVAVGLGGIGWQRRLLAAAPLPPRPARSPHPQATTHQKCPAPSGRCHVAHPAALLLSIDAACTGSLFCSHQPCTSNGARSPLPPDSSNIVITLQKTCQKQKCCTPRHVVRQADRLR